jgi:hypothetical protein
VTACLSKGKSASIVTGAVVQQNAYDSGIPDIGRGGKSRKPLSVSGVRVGPAIQELPHAIYISNADSGHQPRVKRLSANRSSLTDPRGGRGTFRCKSRGREN